VYGPFYHFVRAILSLCRAILSFCKGHFVIVYGPFCHFVRAILSLCTGHFVILLGPFCHFVRVIFAFCKCHFVRGILSWCPSTWHDYIVYNILSLIISSIFINANMLKYRVYRVKRIQCIIHSANEFLVWVHCNFICFHLKSVDSFTVLYTTISFSILNTGEVVFTFKQKGLWISHPDTSKDVVSSNLISFIHAFQANFKKTFEQTSKNLI